MSPIRRDLHGRCQHERPMGQPRMREGQRFRGETAIPHEEQVEVESSRAVLGPPDAPRPALDDEKSVQKGSRFPPARRDDAGRVEESALPRRPPPRIGFMDPRDGLDADSGDIVQRPESAGQMSPPIPHVRTHPYESRLPVIVDQSQDSPSTVACPVNRSQT